MSEQWDRTLDQIAEICSPSAYLEFIRVEDKALVESGEMTAAYHDLPLIALTAGIFAETMLSRAGDLSSIAHGLDRLWQRVLDERDTASLSDDDAEEDSFFVDELEELRNEADGMLAALEAYVGGAGDPAEAKAVARPKRVSTTPPRVVPDPDGVPASAGRADPGGAPGAAEASAAPGPDGLIQQSMLLIGANLHQARDQFARAGAAMLRGAAYWPLWALEGGPPPIDQWLRGLFGLLDYLRANGWYPLAPVNEQRHRLADVIRQPQPGAAAWSPAAEEAEVEELPEQQRRLMDILLCGSEQLSDEQMADVPRYTPEIVERLADVLNNGEYDDMQSPGKGYGPIHAARLLGKSGSPQAVWPLLQALWHCEPDEIVWSAIVFAFEALGPAAVPALLDSMRYCSTQPDFKAGVAEALGKLGKGDARTFHALEAYYNETTWLDNRISAVMALGNLGDPRAVALLRRALNDRDLEPMDINEVVGAIEELDPNHDSAELERLAARARQRYDARVVRFDKFGQAFCRDCGSLMRKTVLGMWEHIEPRPAPDDSPRSILSTPNVFDLDPRFSKVGRNDPCPCGSGKKFKHCHGAVKPTVH